MDARTAAPTVVHASTLVAGWGGSRVFPMPFKTLDPHVAEFVGDNHRVNSARALRSDGIERPLTSRLDPARPEAVAVMREHARAIESGRPLYRDPISGLSVFTAAFLADRGYCCGSGCRHCPYEQS